MALFHKETIGSIHRRATGLLRSYNNTFHRAIGMAPSEVNETNQEEVWQRMYGHESVGTPKYRVGDCVRISKAKRQFKKGYMTNWTEKVFKIVARTVRSRRFTAWRTGTVNVWRVPSTNPNCRRLLCQKIRRT